MIKKIISLYLLLICSVAQSSEHPYLDAVDPSGRLGQFVDAVKLPYTLYRAHQMYHERLAADLRQQQHQKNVDLHDAIRQNQPERVSQLIRDGAQLNWQDEHGDTALHKAAAFGRTDIVKQLKPKSNLSLINKRGQTAQDMAHGLPEGKTKESTLRLFNPDRAKELEDERTAVVMKRQTDLARQVQPSSQKVTKQLAELKEFEKIPTRSAAETAEIIKAKKQQIEREQASLKKHQEHKAQQIAKDQEKAIQASRNKQYLLDQLPKGQLFFDDAQEAQALLDQRNRQLEEQRKQAAQPRKMGPVPKRGTMLARPAHITSVFPIAKVA